MGRFDNGINYYTSAILNIHFPEDDVRCGQCPLCYEDSLHRAKCRLTGELVYSLQSISDFCPLQFEEVNKDV